MTALIWWVYLIDVFSSMSSIIFTVVFISGLSIGILMVATFIMKMNKADVELNIKKLFKILLVIFCSTSFVYALIPTKSTAYIVMGLMVANSVSDQPEFGKVRELINIKLDEAIKTGKKPNEK